MSNKLQQGLSILYDLELNDYLMARAISKLDNEIASLGHKKDIFKPARESTDFGAPFWIGTGTVAGAIIGAIVGAVQGFIKTTGYIFRLFGAFGGAIEYAIYGAIFGLIASIILCVIFKLIFKADAEKKFKAACIRYEKDIEIDNYRVNNELVRKDFLIKQRNSLVKRRNEATNKLIRYYDTMGIDPKFRNIVPIGYMSEFARLGISRKLEGADGLYYLVNKELRYDQFQCSLNDIAYKLDTIIDKQSELYSAVRQIDQQCDRMVSLTLQSSKKNEKLLSQAVNNTSIAAYNSERISQELAFQNFMLYY